MPRELTFMFLFFFAGGAIETGTQSFFDDEAGDGYLQLCIARSNKL